MTTVQQPAEQSSLIAAVGRSYFVIAFLARLPFAMMVVGVLTLVVAGRDSLALGGLTSAMVGLGAAVVGPFLGAAADRFGQRPALLLAAVVNGVAMVALAWVVYSPLGDPAVLAVAVLVGASAPQVGPMSRSRLVGIIVRRLRLERQERVMNATMAYESAVDETVFVFGPVLVGVTASLVSPAAPIVVAAALTLVAVGAFAVHPSAADTLPSGLDHAQRGPARELIRARLLVVVLGVLGIGFFFGSSLTAVTAFAEDAGHGEQAGLLYGVMGVGSAVLALAVMTFPAGFALRTRWLVFAGVMLAGAVVMYAAGSVPALVLALLLSGIGIGPCLVTLFSLGAERSPRGRNATVMTIMGSAIIVGQAAASAVNGQVAEGFGTHAALAAPMVAAGVVAVAAVGNRLLGRRD